MTVRRVALVMAFALGVLAAPSASQAQSGTAPRRIGILHEGYFPVSPPVEGLKAGLKAAGIEEGRDVTLDIRFTRGVPGAAPAAAVALVRTAPDLIVASGEQATHAVRAATRTIPIVFVRVGDPVASGFANTLAQPSGNLTGVSSLGTELVPKRLEILKVLLPTLRRVWAVYHADDLSSQAAVRKAQEVGPLLKLDIVARAARTSEELVGHLRGVRPGDGLLAPPEVTLNIPGLMLDMERVSRVPAVFEASLWVRAGALVSYGSDTYPDGVQAARLVARVLAGARPENLPVEGSNGVELALNLQAARNLGITIPPEILARADQVIR